MSQIPSDPDVDPAPVATEATVSIPTSSWWSPWLDVAKSKSTEVYEFMKKDLTDLTEVVKSEASIVVNSTAAVLKDTLKLEEPESTANSVKRSVSSFLGTVSNVLNPLPDDDAEEAILIQNDQPIPLSKFQLKLHDLIKNPETFTEPIPETQMTQFNSWLTICDEQMTKEKLTKLLVASPDLHNQFEVLVPDQLSYNDFWRRYLFRKALLEDEESFREAKEKRVQQQAEQLQWDKEKFAEGIELTEEEQIKILSDYENETKSKESGESPKSLRDPSEVLIMKERAGMIVVGNGSQCSNSSADTESKDTDDWEELEDTEAASK